MKIVLILFSLFAFSFEDQIRILDWKGTKVIWLVDERFPTFDFMVQYEKGSLGEKKHSTTSMALDLLTSGTRSYNHQQINEHLEYLGTQISGSTNAEWSNINVSGLVKDSIPLLQKFCHVITDSVFPRKELDKKRKRMISSLKNIASSPSSVANMVFDQLLLEKTAYGRKRGGRIKELKQLNSKDLKRKLQELNKNVHRRIYIRGPEKITIVKNMVIEKCRWGENPPSLKNNEEVPAPPFSGKKIVFVPLKTNQAHIRVGRVLGTKDIDPRDELMVTTHLMGGGFTSLLNHELREKRGLTYGVNLGAWAFKKIGGIKLKMATKNESLEEALMVLQKIYGDAQIGKFSDQVFKKTLMQVSGREVFRLEDPSAILSRLAYYDQINQPYKDILTLGSRVKALKKNNIVKRIEKHLSWKDQLIVIVANKSLLKKLKENFEVEVVKIGDFF